MSSQQEAEEKKKTRRADYEGSLEELPSGKYRYKGRVLGRLVCSSAYRKKTEAKKDYERKVHAVLHPAPPAPEILPTVEDYFGTLLEGPYQDRVQNGTMAPTTWQMYEQVWRLKLCGSRLGSLRLDQVAPEHIDVWVAQLKTEERTTKKGKHYPARPISNSSKGRYIAMLGGAFTYAIVKQKLIDKNPIEHAEKPQAEAVDFITLNATEVEELLHLCDKEDPASVKDVKEKARMIASNRRRRLITLLGLHGFGPAEMCGLRHEDFDGEGVTPQRQRQRLGQLGVRERTRLKTNDRKNWVAVDQELIDLLSERKKGYVLELSPGIPMEPGNLRRTFAGMVKGTKFQNMTPYDLRHTFAQRLLDENVDVKTAAELMRHSVEVFLRRYVRSDRNRKLDAIKKMQEARERVRQFA